MWSAVEGFPLKHNKHGEDHGCAVSMGGGGCVALFYVVMKLE